MGTKSSHHRGNTTASSLRCPQVPRMILLLPCHQTHGFGGGGGGGSTWTWLLEIQAIAYTSSVMFVRIWAIGRLEKYGQIERGGAV